MMGLSCVIIEWTILEIFVLMMNEELLIKLLGFVFGKDNELWFRCVSHKNCSGWDKPDVILYLYKNIMNTLCIIRNIVSKTINTQ